MTVLVIDIGGTHVKLLAAGQAEPRSFPSGPDLTPSRLVEQVQAHAADWPFDAVALGYPGRVGPDGPAADPGNLGNGWVGFDFAAAFGVPVRIINDAAMQALGGYDGGRMLFLGLGTGLGATLVADRVVLPLELGRLKLGGEPLGERLGKAGFEKVGEKAWAKLAAETAEELRDAFEADYVVLGGGHADLVNPLPEKARRGGNDDAFKGGFLLWAVQDDMHDGPPPAAWRVIG